MALHLVFTSSRPRLASTTASSKGVVQQQDRTSRGLLGVTVSSPTLRPSSRSWTRPARFVQRRTGSVIVVASYTTGVSEHEPEDEKIRDGGNAPIRERELITMKEAVRSDCANARRAIHNVRKVVDSVFAASDPDISDSFQDLIFHRARDRKRREESSFTRDKRLSHLKQLVIMSVAWEAVMWGLRSISALYRRCWSLRQGGGGVCDVDGGVGEEDDVDGHTTSPAKMMHQVLQRAEIRRSVLNLIQEFAIQGEDHNTRARNLRRLASDMSQLATRNSSYAAAPRTDPFLDLLGTNNLLTPSLLPDPTIWRYFGPDIGTELEACADELMVVAVELQNVSRMPSDYFEY